MEIIIYLFLIILLAIFFLFLLKKYNITNLESFDNFSPYLNNLSYPYVFLKNNDSRKFARTLSKWETQFNCNDEGYYNAGFYPAMPNIKSYVGYKKNKLI